jgi:alkylation response protein AidB-like acyl-CoA dehydrogenase
MTTNPNSKLTMRGAEFIVKSAEGMSFFIPEERTEEQQMFIDMARQFVEQEIWPNTEKIEKQIDNISAKLLERTGELGLLGAEMPEDFGGMSLDTNTNTLLMDVLGPMGSFNTTFAAHTGIGMLPVLYYGTQQQKEKYLPGLIEGRLKASYCLTEPGSGSDALAAKTKAVLSEDKKHYILNGQKIWISNAGFANFFIVFAKVDGEKFTAFIIEGLPEGMSLGEEEDKMGIKGSSTRQVFFEDVHVSVENLLGEIGKGHKIAFNVLNMGRYKLGAMCVGGAKKSIDLALKYAMERHQFNQPISNFGAIKYKLANMLIRNFAVESAVYRTSSLIQDQTINQIANNVDPIEAKRAAVEEFAIESSILKIAGSETTDYVVDETLQIYGGNGFSEEYIPARMYRDNRITRIYEGTNEINRLLIVDMLLKRALKGTIDFINPAWEVQKELKQMPKFGQSSQLFEAEKKAVQDFRKLVLMVAGGAAKKQMDGELDLEQEQQIVTFISDMITDLYLSESMLLRVEKLTPDGTEAHYMHMLRVFLHDTNSRIAKNAIDALSGFTSGDLQKIFMMGVKRFTAYPVQDVVQSRKYIANFMIEKGEYPLFR